MKSDKKLSAIIWGVVVLLIVSFFVWGQSKVGKDKKAYQEQRQQEIEAFDIQSEEFLKFAESMSINRFLADAIVYEGRQLTKSTGISLTTFDWKKSFLKGFIEDFEMYKGNLLYYKYKDKEGDLTDENIDRYHDYIENTDIGFTIEDVEFAYNALYGTD